MEKNKNLENLEAIKKIYTLLKDIDSIDITKYMVMNYDTDFISVKCYQDNKYKGEIYASMFDMPWMGKCMCKIQLNSFEYLEENVFELLSISNKLLHNLMIFCGDTLTIKKAENNDFRLEMNGVLKFNYLASKHLEKKPVEIINELFNYFKYSKSIHITEMETISNGCISIYINSPKNGMYKDCKMFAVIEPNEGGIRYRLVENTFKYLNNETPKILPLADELFCCLKNLNGYTLDIKKLDNNDFEISMDKKVRGSHLASELFKENKD